MKTHHANNNTQTWTQKSPFGGLIISAGERGVSHVHLNGARHAGRTVRVEHNGSPAPKAQRAVSAAFERYFAGDAQALDKLPVDLSGVTSDFQRAVLETLRKLVKPGMTMSYGELAAAAGWPGAARAVGATMANNPVPLIVACHRVLASDGTLHGYGGGLDMKRALLTMEGVELPKSGRLR
jgi:methylated-DNA-[protein]-cysteine S-methyltransferase